MVSYALKSMTKRNPSPDKVYNCHNDEKEEYDDFNVFTQDEIQVVGLFLIILLVLHFFHLKE